VVSSPFFPETKRVIRINANVHSELFATLDFDKKTYSPGTEVAAKLKVRRPDGQKLRSGSAFSYYVTNEHTTLLIDSKQRFNRQGEAEIKFTLSNRTSFKIATVVVNVFEGYFSHPVTSEFSIPIVAIDDFDVIFHPEMHSSDVVPEVANKIYF